jgi:outer membrane protein OmpA-like peptidoglycan-associated protein
VVAALQQRLNDAGIENTRVSDQEEGVVLILERIGFPPDSARILPDEEQRLTIIGEILSDFPENDLLITGHTALAGTAAGREQLSVSRARAVGEFFLANDVREPSRILYRGVGAAEPIADNETAQGRSRNRRVEIMVLDN